jgi:hypothetical protein
MFLLVGLLVEVVFLTDLVGLALVIALGLGINGPPLLTLDMFDSIPC